MIFGGQTYYFLHEILTSSLPTTHDRPPWSSHPWPCRLDLSKLDLSPMPGKTLQQHIPFPARLGEAQCFLPGPSPARCPFLCLLLARTPAVPRVYGEGMVGEKRKACPGMRAGFNEVLIRGACAPWRGNKSFMALASRTAEPCRWPSPRSPATLDLYCF